MKFGFANSILVLAAIISFVSVASAPRDSGPGPWLTAATGIVLLRRAIIPAPQPALVILSGCVLTALVVGGDYGLLNINKPLWVGLILVAGIVYAFWERIEKLWW